jgi:hypothetical protein
MSMEISAMTKRARPRAPIWLPAGLAGLVVGTLATASIMHVSRTARIAGSDIVGTANASPRDTAATASFDAPTRGAPPAAGLRSPSRRAPADAVAAAVNTQTPTVDRPSYEQLLATNRALHGQIAQLKRDASGETGSPRTYDLGAGELERMATTCELRWDIPSLTMKPSTLPDDVVAKLALSGPERTTINRAFAAAHARLVDEVRRTYAALTGDDNPGSMSPEAMYAEIVDKVPESELQTIFQRLAHERAGLVPTPTTAPTSSVENMFRTLTMEGNRLEDELAAALDPQLARSLRDLNGGWSSKFSSSHGCPR